MSKEIESISDELFNKVRSRFPAVTLGNETADDTKDPTQARFFNFTYTDTSGTEYGQVTLSLVDEKSLKVYFSQNITKNMDRDQRLEWYAFMRNLRKFTKRHPILKTFDVRDINKSNLELQDVKQQAKTDIVATAKDVPMSESRLYGTSHKSYADMGECRVMIKHTSMVNDDVHGSRSRQIESIFIETGRGERFRLDHTNLHGARAMARHLSEGGSMYDDIAECINTMVYEMSAMRHFVRATKNRQFEDQETADMSRSAIQHYQKVKGSLRHLASKRHYDEFKERYHPEDLDNEDIDVDALKERFVKKVYDDRFTDALPIVYRAHKKQKAEAAGQLGSELEEWADTVTEGTWSIPDTADKVKALKVLLQRPIKVGMDGLDATSDLSQLIGSDELNAQITDLAGSQGPDADATPLVKAWLQDNMPAIFAQVKATLEKTGRDAQTNFAPQTSPQPDNSREYGATGMDWPLENPVVKESDNLDFLKSLAGLKK